MTVLSALLSIGLTGPGAGQTPPPSRGDLAALERAWHGCVRETYLRQPREQSRAASQRSALDACQAGEDAYVAAAMRGDGMPERRARGLADRATAWASSVAAEVLDPVSSWLDAIRR